MTAAKASRPTKTRTRIVLAAITLAAMAALTGTMVACFGFLSSSNRLQFELATTALWVLFTLAVLAIRRVPVRSAIVLIVAGSIAIGGAAMLGPPNTSTDSARYSWDGIVQNAGISPYKYVPRDDALTSLRTGWLFPPPVITDSGAQCPLPRTALTHSSPSQSPICTAINRPGVPTIYPPLSELLFAAVRGVVPVDAQYWPFQLVGLLMTVAITLLLIRGLHRRGLNPRWAALWALGPLTTSEAITNSHIDILGSLLTVLAVFAIAQGARWRGGVLLGAAIAAKLIPILAAPAVLRREPWKIIVAAIATFTVLYIPYVATTGLAVIGYLPGYLSEEGFNSGNRFVLLRTFLPPIAALVVAVILLLAVVIVTLRFSNPERPWLGQLAVIGAALVIASPPFAWYSLLLIPFVAMSGRWEWLAIPMALAVHQLVPAAAVFPWSLFVAVLVLAAGSLARWDLSRGVRSRIGARFPRAIDSAERAATAAAPSSPQ